MINDKWRKAQKINLAKWSHKRLVNNFKQISKTLNTSCRVLK